MAAPRDGVVMFLVSCLEGGPGAFLVRLPARVRSLTGFPERRAESASRRAARCTDRASSWLIPCRRELGGGLRSRWPGSVALLCIFEESLKMKAKRVALCGFLDLKKKSPPGPGLVWAPGPIPPAVVGKRDVLVVLRLDRGPREGQEQSGPPEKLHAPPVWTPCGGLSTSGTGRCPGWPRVQS